MLELACTSKLLEADAGVARGLEDPVDTHYRQLKTALMPLADSSEEYRLVKVRRLTTRTNPV